MATSLQLRHNRKGNKCMTWMCVAKIKYFVDPACNNINKYNHQLRLSFSFACMQDETCTGLTKQNKYRNHHLIFPCESIFSSYFFSVEGTFVIYASRITYIVRKLIFCVYLWVEAKITLAVSRTLVANCDILTICTIY